MDGQDDMATLREQVRIQAGQVRRLEHALGLLEDKDEIRRLQYCYGYFMDNRMFREMVELFADHGAWMEIGGRGRYEGRERIHAFLLDTTVHPAWQRRGIGRELVRQATQAARERGMEWLHVDYEPHLDAFYRGCGFTPTLAGLIRLDESA